MSEEKQKISKKTKAIIIVLLCLLLLTAGTLTARVVYLNFFADKSSTTVVPDNLIGKSSENADQGSSKNDVDSGPVKSASSKATQNKIAKATTVELYRGKASYNEKFEINNMLPGDTEAKYFAIKVNHNKRVGLFFSSEVTKQTKSLANVLNIKITRLENNNVIYNGSFTNINIDGYGEFFAATQATETVAYYKIEVSLPSSVGNEYQSSKLSANLNWYVTDEDALIPPQTGDTSNIMLWLAIMLCSLTTLIIPLFSKRKKKENENAKQN